MLSNAPLNQELDKQIKHEAALLHADGEARQAVSLLINRINETKGSCGIWIWLLVLDLYRVSNSQAPYEKLALHFAQQTGTQAPNWDPDFNGTPNSSGSWRNALILEGSPLAVDEEKIRDWVLASKDAGASRLDLSRMRLDPAEDVARKEAERLLEAMRRLRRTGVPTLLMGETDLVSRLDRRVEGGGNNRDIETVWWELRMELHQWRGEEQAFDEMADKYAMRFQFCPVDYDPAGALAKSPGDDNSSRAVETDGDVLELPFHVVDAREMIDWINRHWDEGKQARISLRRCGRMNSSAARDLVQFLVAKHGIGEVGGDTQGQHTLVFQEVSPLLAALFESTGVQAYAQIEHRDAKLLALLDRRQAERNKRAHKKHE